MYIIIFIIYYEKCCALHVKYTFYIRVYFVYQNPKQLIAIIKCVKKSAIQDGSEFKKVVTIKGVYDMYVTNS